MSGEALIVGDAADFQPALPESPRWEHQLLIAEHGMSPLAIDTLRTVNSRRFLSVKGVDVRQLAQIAGRTRGQHRILAQSEQSGYLVSLALFLFGVPTPLFIIFHGQRWWTRRNRWLAACARSQRHIHFLCLAVSLAKILIEELGIDPARVHVTGFGADADFFRCEAAFEPGLIVSAGTASRDYRTLMAAVEGLAARVEIAADSTWYREELNISGAPRPSNVSVFSAGDYRALRSLYARANLIIVPLIPSRYAAGYAVIAEAMAMGKTVIATRTEAPSDLIADGGSGFYVPQEDAKTMRATIEHLLGQPAEVRKTGVAARAAVEESANVRAYVSRIVATMDAQTGTASRAADEERQDD